MMKFVRFLAVCAAFALAPIVAHAQSQIGSGHVMGNPSAAQRTATDATMTAILDRALGSTRGAIIERGASAWGLILPGTAGKPFVSGGAGADGSYATLGIVGGGTNCAAASGTCLDNITGFASTGLVARTGAGTYSFIPGVAGQILAGATPAFTATPTLGASGTLGSLTFGNATTGLLTLQPVAGALGTPTVLIPALADTLVSKTSTDILLNKTLDTAGTGNSFKINGQAITSVTGAAAVVAVAGTSTNATIPRWVSGVLNSGALTDDGTNIVGAGAISATAGLLGTTVTGTTSYKIGAKVAWSATAPSVNTGFCTSPSISNNNGTAAFTITIGSACAVSTGVLTMPAASVGWACNFRNVTNNAANAPSQTASTSTSVSVTNYVRTTGVAGNWTAADVIVADCTAY